MKVDKNEVILQAIEKLKKSTFGMTGLKVELEGNLSRGYDYDDEYDEDTETCDTCDGDGRYTCPECMGDWGADTCGCGDEQCDDSHGECEYCDEGSNRCDDCNGEGEIERERDESTSTGSLRYCHDFLMKELEALGLAKYDENEWFSLKKTGRDSHWIPQRPLVYAEFYNDGSVDSEFTFTLAMDDPKSVFLLPKVVVAWNKLVEQIGNGIDVDGAGMHMALLNDPECHYSGHQEYTSIDARRVSNFGKSMNLLLPALFFLGACNGKSRGMDFRRPQVGMDTHRSAIDYRGGALEFRVFDTCYEKPDQLLDNVVVMSKCIGYWSDVYKPSGLSKILQEVHFGNSSGYELERLYRTTEHIDMLNAGLTKLKPDYLTIKEIKTQREFKTTKGTVKSLVNRRKKQATAEYKEYEERFEWSLNRYEIEALGNKILEHSYNIPSGREVKFEIDKALETAKEAAKQAVERRKLEKKPVSQYVEEVVQHFIAESRGQFTLAER